GNSNGSRYWFELTQTEWAQLMARARELHTTPYVFVLTSLQLALERIAHLTSFSVHSIVCERGDTAEGLIGNFHSVARIEMCPEASASFDSAVRSTAAAVGRAIEHCT